MSGSRWLAVLILVAVLGAGTGTAYVVLRDDRTPAPRVESAAPAPPPFETPAPPVESEPAPKPIDFERLAARLASHTRRLVWETLKEVTDLGPRAAPLRGRISDLTDSKDPTVSCHAMIALMRIDGNRDLLHRLALRVGSNKNAAFYLERIDPVLGRALFAGYSARKRLDDASNAAQALDELLALACADDAGLGERIRERLRTADGAELEACLDFATRIDPLPGEVRAELLTILETGGAQRVRAVVARLGGQPGRIDDPQPFATALGRHYDAGNAELRIMTPAALANLHFCDDAWTRRLAEAAAGYGAGALPARYAIHKLQSEAAGVGTLLMQVAQRAELPRLDLMFTLMAAAPDAAPALLVRWIEIGTAHQKKQLLHLLRGAKADRETIDRLVQACETGQAGPLHDALVTTICLDPQLKSPRVRALVTNSLREPPLEPRRAAANALRWSGKLDAELAALVLGHANSRDPALREAVRITAAQVKEIDVAAPATRRQLLDLARNGARAPGQAADPGSQAVFIALMLRAYAIDMELRKILLAALASKSKSVRIAAIRGFADVEPLTPAELTAIKGMWRDYDSRIWNLRKRIVERHSGRTPPR